MRNLLFLAPPGAGKGTQSELLYSEYGICSISTGELLREASKREDAVGERIRTLQKQGKLVDDETVLELFEKQLQSLSNQSVIFDGFPRNINQAKALDLILGNMGKKLDDVFLFEIPKEVLEKRITGRRQCKNCGKIHNIYLEENLEKCSCGGELSIRSDDTIESFKIRYQTYLDMTMPLIEYYDKRGIVHRIDANQDIEKVHDLIVSTLDLGELHDSN